METKVAEREIYLLKRKTMCMICYLTVTSSLVLFLSFLSTTRIDVIITGSQSLQQYK